MKDPVGRPVVHLDRVAPRGLPGDGDEGCLVTVVPSPKPGHLKVGAGVER